jgi:putative ABC transport system ATP-binding protein
VRQRHLRHVPRKPSRCLRRTTIPSMSDPIIAVEHVTRSVTDSTGTLTILHDIDFQLPRRQSVAIVGASGSGKSTLLALMAGLDVPSQRHGAARRRGHLPLDEDARAGLRARKLGFVFQSFQLLGHLTALENVMLPLELLGRRRCARPATEMLQRVGLGERLGHYPRTLSGGEQQRVALARAFVVEPAVLLADEPTGSLDHATGETVMALMFEMNRESGTTLVLVTHDRRIAARCDRQAASCTSRQAACEGSRLPSAVAASFSSANASKHPAARLGQHHFGVDRGRHCGRSPGRVPWQRCPPGRCGA